MQENGIVLKTWQPTGSQKYKSMFIDYAYIDSIQVAAEDTDKNVLNKSMPYFGFIAGMPFVLLGWLYILGSL